ncbi:hypothetical protein C8A00DRAFT_17491 [Chaetomidium leptoderma]|uniref:Uncharacterized protein n=1 Tax=Chaetomidium leptoderma TaxID=669021 RepID=A0AAN6VGJ7_9PEZI|nr:hypothetical protein C8A00DRAFT_17491 [Chaetomidium leptoderma]
MPNLVAIDVSVTDSRIRLVFSDRAVAAAYAAYLRTQDQRPPQYGMAIPGYTRAPQLHTTSKEVSLSLPEFMTWFITCRLPDDEDAVTFTCMDEHEVYAARWAEAMLLFESVPSSSSSSTVVGHNHNHHNNNHHHQQHQHQHQHHHHHDGSSSGPAKQLHVRRLWNRAHLLQRLEELRRRASVPTPPATTTPTMTTMVNGRSRVSSPTWGNGNGARVPVALAAVPAMQRGDIWW